MARQRVQCSVIVNVWNDLDMKVKLHYDGSLATYSAHQLEQAAWYLYWSSRYYIVCGVKWEGEA